MGYAYYTLPDGREAGYGVEAECDKPGCQTRIDRGLGYLCGQNPNGHKDAEEPGCGNYYCPDHQANHACANPECGAWDEDENLCCQLVRDHDLPHRDVDTGKAFASTAG
ncbi:hypothetical protein GS551_05360 [Rhodococcus hoagii]|uniref:Uncharacterized protein n=1 Tax=Rhodococcus hoagii TaxID=43767 RepID=A0AAE2W4Q2_RHOHA|nr:hypothetical protein [Prescottella equi]NKS11985.1 hypothetical protein [Prescottella equi]